MTARETLVVIILISGIVFFYRLIHTNDRGRQFVFRSVLYCSYIVIFAVEGLKYGADTIPVSLCVIAILAFIVVLILDHEYGIIYNHGHGLYGKKDSESHIGGDENDNFEEE